MRHAQSITAEITSRNSSLGRRPIRTSIFAAIVEALHRSRRLQATRTLRQYRHLMDTTEGNGVVGELSARSERPVGERLEPKSSAPAPILTERLLLAAVLAAFLLLHILAGVILLRDGAPRDPPRDADMQSQLYD